MTPLRCYENDLFLKFLYTRRVTPVKVKRVLRHMYALKKRLLI